MKKRFIVKFLKDVVGTNGRHVETCQNWFEIDATDADHAAEAAKRHFCESKRAKSWQLYADRIVAAEAEFAA